VKLILWRCDRCHSEWRGSDCAVDHPEKMYMSMSDGCMGQVYEVDLSFEHLCRQCVHEIGKLTHSLEFPDREAQP